MHGRPRKAAKPEDEAASAAKAQKLRALQEQFFSHHHNKIYTKEAVEISAKLLEINPESYTAWNYRKLAVEYHLSQPESNPDSVKSILDDELRVVESALRQNFKSYGAWHHRKWVLSKGHSSIDHELRLLDKFQKADSRLEAMQLLSGLNLRNNKLRSFTALEALRKLKSLTVLDISYNQIGEHSIDTTRYLCSSPLSHSAGSEWNKDEIGISDAALINYWEAFFIFKELNLKQLDIVGNAVADEKFKSILVKVLPTLKRLDGELLD
ncbi:hypothetical protein COLO4_35257 [Corchorus olitorius]|uniref:Geranylgeranyl transferase type-2 subunit alpha n=1 Tax=Corchorus olitorius TaxID=93759 RepID=A0A1R3GHP2_9ROSI|nr:hypothetical protein COLO4_35257 [Corchorus olitorius]